MRECGKRTGLYMFCGKHKGGGWGRYCHEELGPGEGRERKAGVWRFVGGDGRGKLLSDPIFVAVGDYGGSQQNSLFVYTEVHRVIIPGKVWCARITVHVLEKKPAKATV